MSYYLQQTETESNQMASVLL